MGISPKKLLRDCPEDQIGVSIPAPLSARLDVLVGRANHAGENTSRKEVLAALILDAPEEDDQVVAAVRRYRTASADEAVPEGVNADAVLDPPDRPPGPRPRRQA